MKLRWKSIERVTNCSQLRFRLFTEDTENDFKLFCTPVFHINMHFKYNDYRSKIIERSFPFAGLTIIHKLRRKGQVTLSAVVKLQLDDVDAPSPANEPAIRKTFPETWIWSAFPDLGFV